jgi:hypothetical protein
LQHLGSRRDTMTRHNFANAILNTGGLNDDDDDNDVVE